jgi:hypothetical protein
MLVKLIELVQTSGFYEGEQREIARDTSVIDGIDPTAIEDYEGDCCFLRTTCDEEPLVVAGNLDSVLAILQAVECSAQEKLDAIRAIACEGE